MRKKLSVGNPFANIPTWGYPYEFITPGMHVLDYGCNDCTFLDGVSARKEVEAFGADKNRDLVVKINRPNVVHIEKGIPFPDANFDIVTLLDVLEHVHDQKTLLDEIYRVLKPDGRFVLTVPRQNVFSFLDHGNFKYRFPRLHKFWYLRKHTPEEYDYRYVNNPFGLIGDIEKEKAWHQHFRDSELRALLKQSKFKIVEMDACDLLNDLLVMLQYLGLKFPDKFWYWQEYKFQSRMLLCLASKG